MISGAGNPAARFSVPSTPSTVSPQAQRILNNPHVKEVLGALGIREAQSASIKPGLPTDLVSTLDSIRMILSVTPGQKAILAGLHLSEVQLALAVGGSGQIKAIKKRLNSIKIRTLSVEAKAALLAAFGIESTEELVLIDSQGGAVFIGDALDEIRNTLF